MNDIAEAATTTMENELMETDPHDAPPDVGPQRATKKLLGVLKKMITATENDLKKDKEQLDVYRIRVADLEIVMESTKAHISQLEKPASTKEK